MRQIAIDQALQPLRNLHKNPGALGGSGSMIGYWGGSAPNATTVGAVDAAWAQSKKAYRVTWTNRTVTSGDIGMAIQTFDGIINQIAGRKVTAVFDIVASVGGWNLDRVLIGNVVPASTPIIHARGDVQPVTAGVPARCWITFTLAEGTTSASSIRVGVTNLPLTAGVWVEASNFDLYEGDYDPNRTYAHGDLPGWRWLGTPWLSESVGYPEPAAFARNLANNPQPVSFNGYGHAGGTGNLTLIQTGAPNGGSFVRKTYTSSGAGGGIYFGNTVSSRVRAIPGHQYVVSGWIRTSKNISMRVVAERKSLAGVLTDGAVNGTLVSIQANTWTRINLMVAAGSLTEAFTIAFYQTGTDWSIGDTLDVAQVMVTDGTTLHPYADGKYPGWRWIGQADSSESTGYPYTLESIAGPLLFDVDKPGTTINLSAASHDPATNGVAVFSVVDVLSLPAPGVTSPIVDYGAPGPDTTPPNKFTSRLIGGSTNGVSNINTQTRVTTGAGPNIPVSGSTGRGIVVSGLLPGGRCFVASSWVPDVAVVNNPSTIVSGATNSVVYSYPNTSIHSLLRTVGIRGADQQTINRTMAWLARQYGAPVPDGY